MNDKGAELFSSICAVLQSQKLGVLATQGEVYPYCTLVGFVATDDCKEVVFATLRDTSKFRNVSKNKHVSLLIDTQKNSATDFKDAEALTVLGTAGEVKEERKKEYVALYLKKHPYLEDFIKTPNCAVMRVSVEKYILVQNFQNVLEYTVE